jgi:hypothetical protein
VAAPVENMRDAPYLKPVARNRGEDIGTPKVRMDDVRCFLLDHAPQSRQARDGLAWIAVVAREFQKARRNRQALEILLRCSRTSAEHTDSALVCREIPRQPRDVIREQVLGSANRKPADHVKDPHETVSRLV